MIVFIVIYVLLVVSIFSPPLLVVSLPLTYSALRSWRRSRQAARQAEQVLAEQQRRFAIARAFR